jgi:hypothetical protein
MKPQNHVEPAAESLTSEYPPKDGPRPPTAGDGADDPVRVLLPDEPPPLTPDAARALFRLLLNVHRRRSGALDD